MNRTVILVVTLLSFAHCSTAASGPVDESRQIRYGETVKVGGTAVKFSAVEDSRCPRTVTCVWAGDAAVTLESGASRVTLHTNGTAGSDSGKLGTLNMTLVEVQPERASSDAPKQAEYVATVRFKR